MRIHLLPILLALTVTACGSQDYDEASKPKDVQVPAPNQSGPVDSPTNEVHLAPRTPSEGYGWRLMKWIGLPDSRVEDLKCRVQDSHNVDHFVAFGSALIAGAVLGPVIRGSGMWFFGKPIEPGEPHPFWGKFDQSVRSAGQGMLRGPLVAGTCEALLTGVPINPLGAALGPNFMSISTAITIGGLSAIASASKVDSWLESILDRGPSRTNRGKGSLYNGIAVAKRWSKRSELGKNLRYRVGPHLVIFGIGSGVGLLVYENLQGNFVRDENCRSKIGLTGN